MPLESFEKQNYESFFIAADYTPVLESGEVLILGNCSVVAEDSEGVDKTAIVLDVPSLVLDNSDTYLKVRCRVGDEDLSPYKITFYGVTDLSNKWEVDVNMKIKEL